MAEEEARKSLQQQAYEVLSAFFSSHGDHVVEISMLPPYVEPPNGFLLQERLAVGIPKKILALAFIEARRRFFEGLKSENDTLSLEASCIIILFDPGHITAANFRKRRLLEVWKEELGRGEGGPREFARLEQRELVFLDSILTSPLHRQSKSPTLWHHRFWLVNLSLSDVHVVADKLSCSRFFEGELQAVFKAGENHPKNYYAWQYARRLLVRTEELVRDAPEYRKFYDDVKSSWVKSVTIWCRKHPSDTSGWSFLLFLLPRVEDLSERTAIVSEVMDYAIKFQLGNQSLWVFVRTALASVVFKEDRHALVDKLRGYGTGFNAKRDAITQGAQSERLAAVAMHWIETHSIPTT